MPDECAEAIRIAYAEKEDFEKVFHLLKQLWPDRELDHDVLKRIYHSELSDDKALMRCAWKDTELLGFVAGSLNENFLYAGKYIHLHVLIVDESKRGTHIGTQILNAIIEFAERNGYRAVELDSNFHRQAAHGFYEHYGFGKRGFVFTKDI